VEIVDTRLFRRVFLRSLSICGKKSKEQANSFFPGNMPQRFMC
jgi:hypothetical protein